MVQVNLLGKKKGIKKQRSIFSIVGLGVFGLLSAYFLFQVVMVVIRYVSVTQKLNVVKEETELISGQILRDNERLNRFILTKLILSEILSLRSKQFDYSSYLDQAQLLVPVGSNISGVDFQTRGYVNVRALSNTVDDLGRLEKTLRSADLSASDFDNITFRSVSKAEEGFYRTDMLFRIKKENGNK